MGVGSHQVWTDERMSSATLDATFTLSLAAPDLSDPSKFTNQIKRESRMNLAARPSIKRHSTSIRLTDAQKPSRRRIQSAKDVTSPVRGGSLSPLDETECTSGEKAVEVLVAMDSCVSTLELVQLQMEGGGVYMYMHMCMHVTCELQRVILISLSLSLAPPMLMLWVGLASGYVAAYGVNFMKNSPKRLELIPTR